MKTIRTISLYVTMAAASLMTLSCNKNESPSPDPTPGSKVDICITGNFNTFSTKAEIENIFMMKWSNGDTVYVYGTTDGTEMINLGSLTAAVVSGTDNCVADLSGSITAPKEGTKLTLVYSPLLQSAPTPSSNAISIDLKSQGGKEDSVAFVAYTAVDYQGESSTYRVSFGFATSVLRVNVSDLTANTALTKATLGQIETACKLTFAANELPTVTGETADTITRTLSGCSANAKGNAAFYVAVPIITANADRKLTVVQGSGVTEYAGFATGAKDAGKMMNSIASKQYIPVDLSSGATANCYIVSQPGTYKFKTVKGNSSTSVGTVDSVSVLWESYGTSTSPTVGDLIRTDLSFTDSYITFTTGSQFPAKKGNAVIAAKDASGNILWSWHIWCADQPEEQIYTVNPAHTVYVATMMDRNLGATNATKGDVGALGLLYQWGRKDPFLGADDTASTTPAASTGSWNTVAAPKTPDEAVRIPTTFITGNLSWCESTDNLWKNTSAPYKTIYDPCPAGYRIPDGGSTSGVGVWATAFNSSNWTTASNWDSTNKGMDFGTTDKKLVGTGSCWYPAVGQRKYDTGELSYVGMFSRNWSCTFSIAGTNAYVLYFGNSGAVNVNGNTYCASSASVRCVKE